MRRIYVLSLLATAALGLALLGASASRSQTLRSYVVVYGGHASPTAARDAVKASGGRIVRENLKIGVATAVSRNSRFLSAVRRQPALFGAALDRPVGSALSIPRGSDLELAAARAAARGTASATAEIASTGSGEPLADKQWGMQMIHATAEGSYAIERGRSVLVGILDTGVDGSHPDIAPNFSEALSRNFTTDIPLVDGPCEEEPDASCSDPANVDENSHGTHVASIIGSPINDLGVAGVAPEATLVNLRAGQDSGYFFLQPSVDALTYAGDHGIDVVNMSYFIDPWLYNCRNNHADSPEAQMEQRTIIRGTQRALEYAHEHGVVLIAASGNEHTDLGAKTKIDVISPDYPPGIEYERTVDNNCLDLPTEGENVLSINSIGPSTRKADYSNYGVEQSTVATPGGFFRDDPLWKATDPPEVRNLAGIPNLILAAYPENVAREFGEINPDGTPNTPFVLRDCREQTCAYYQYLQGTSMASPHAVGVAALIVGRLGEASPDINPNRVQRILQRTATDHACPQPRLHSYADKLRPPSFDALCVGSREFNGFYGHGIADALRAVQRGDEDNGDD
jgi:lantibiotic leader peptide-processing serine protease